MAALPYIQLYVADYLADTMHLNTEEHGAYLLLIMNYWQTGKPIQENRIQAITKLDNGRYKSVIDTLQQFFNVTDDGRWIHSRIEADLDKVRAKSNQAKRAGKASASKRWGSQDAVINKKSNGRYNPVERKSNHTDTDTDTDTDTEKDISTVASTDKSENTNLRSKHCADKQNLSSPIPKNHPKARKRFIKPTYDEIAAYCCSRKNTIDAGAFLDYYDSNGWMVGRAAMKDWQATVRTWERKQKSGIGPPGNRKTLSAADRVQLAIEERDRKRALAAKGFFDIDSNGNAINAH